MALITANQLAVGFFNIAAGGYTAEATLNIAANEALAANSYINLPFSFLNPQLGGTNLYGNQEFAAGLVARFMPAASATLATSLTTYVTNYIAANPTLGRGQVAIEMIKAVVAISPNDVVLSAAAAPFKAKIALADTSTSTSKDLSLLGVVVNGPSPVPVTTFNFTTVAGETLTGTASDDTFNARILDNANSAQSGDKIVGGAGIDRMNLDIGNSQRFSITLESTGVEQVAVRGQAIGIDSSNNNLSSSGTGLAPVQIASTLDAQRMENVTQWESNNSRADVIIEDVRISGGAATKTVTVAMVETDPGNVDFGLYFNQLSLRNTSSGTASINVFLIDAAAAQNPATAATPLLNQNFNAYTFYANGVQVVLGGPTSPAASAAIDAATTYAQLQAAFQLALVTANVGGVVKNLTGEVVVSLSGPVNLTAEALKATTSAPVAPNFLNLTGEILTLTTSNSTAISATAPNQPPGGWTANGPAPITGAIVQTFNSGATTSAELVTVKVILDDVGLGSTGGDLVIGGQSVGETSDSRGVERFEVEVRDNSKLQTINGTNNALREVVLTNGATDNVNRTTTTSTADSAYRVVTANAGDLTVNGNANTGTSGTTIGFGSDTILKGVNSGNSTLNPYAANHHGAFGFTDVRLIDGSAMTGRLAYTAQITLDSIAKYITRVDTAANPAGDVAGAANTNFNVLGANFIYTGGANNDTIAITLDQGVVGSRSSVLSGQSDITLVVNGGAGDDRITVNLKSGTGGALNWAANQDLNNNITINGGTGADTIRTPGAGDIVIDAGEGNDVLYTDNTGLQTTADLFGSVGINNLPTTTSNGRYVFNTFNQAGATLPDGRVLNDMRTDVNTSVNLYKGTVQVSFKDILSTTVTLANTTTYKTTDLEINQAIKQAINSDAILNKLLIAQDGPGNTLIVTSLVDGARTIGELVVTIAAPVAATVFTAAELAGMSVAYNAPSLTSVAALAIHTGGTGIATAGFLGSYVTAAALDSAFAPIIGAASTSASDNFITPGAGNDVIVLGTTVGTTLATGSNEVITFASGFGDDTIVNFTVAGFGIDHLNFNAFMSQGTLATPTTAAVAAAAVSLSPGAINNVDNEIAVITETPGVNDTLALVTTLIKAVVDIAGQATVTKQLYIAVNGTNIGTVYSVTNGIAINDAVVTREGSIDLADTAWATLTVANLVGVGPQFEGASTF